MRRVENARRRTDPARNRKSKERAPETEGSPNKTKKEKEKRNRSLIFEKYPSTISLVKVSDPSFLFFLLALSNGEANI